MRSLYHRAVGIFISVSAISLTISLAAGACSSTPARPQVIADVQDIRNAVLIQPEVFELNLPENFFVRDGRGLQDSPGTRSCHTQGLAIAGDSLLVSCVLYDERQRGNADARTSTGKSFVLRAPLCQITGCGDGAAKPKAGAQVDWQIQELTEQVPEREGYRITQQVRQKEQLTREDRAVRRLMNHPSGLAHDPVKGGVWVANATYAPDTYAHMFLLDPENLSGDGPVRKFVSVKNHIGAVMLVDDRYLLGWSWGSRNLIVAEMSGSNKSIMSPHPRLDTEDHIEIQDCSYWKDTRVLCGGVYHYEVNPDAPDVPLGKEQLGDPKRDTIRVREGRIQILDIDVDKFPQVVVEMIGTVRGRLTRTGEAGNNLGVRKYRIDAQGAHKSLVDNDYGGYTSPRPLTHEGMAVSPDKRYIYFLPDDLPAGKLIRMRLTE